MTAVPRATTQEVTPQWQTYLSVELDVEPYLQFKGITPEASVKSILQLVTDALCDWAQRYLGRPIAPTRFFRYYSGWTNMNGATLQLDYYPVLEVHSVNEWWGSSGKHELKEQVPGNQGESEVYQIAPLQGLLIRTFQGLVQRPFFPGSRNVEVDWTAGYDPIPPAIRLGTLEAIHKWWVNTQEITRSVNVPQGHGIDYGGGASLDTSLLAVQESLKPILSGFLQQGIG